MQALRQIQKAETDKVFIRIPRHFIHHNLEIIVIPMDDVSDRKTWPPDFFEETAGGFSATPIIRQDQGKFVERNVIE